MSHMFGPIRGAAALFAVGLAVTGLTACGGSSSHDTHTVVIATHDSWAMPKSVLADFTRQTGYTVKIQQQGDAGELTNKLVLTKDSPIADGVYGIDNTFATRAADAGVLADYVATDLPASADRFRPSGAAGRQLTPVDYGDVCVNVDDAWFAKRHLDPPKTLADLTTPEYKDLFVVPGATTSSPGLAFLAATVAAFGADGWQDYWRALLANGVKIDPGWTEAYEGDFTAGGGKGTRPIVLSYSSSPPFTIPKGADKPTTSALLDTCFRQVEYAGVLKGARNPKGAKAFVNFLLSRQAQATLPDNMYVYPVDASVRLPKLWAKWAAVSPKPWYVSPAEITAKRADWLREWRDLTSQ